MGMHCRSPQINQLLYVFFCKYSCIRSSSTPALKAKLGWRLFMPRRVLQTSSTMLSIWAWMSLRLMSERGLQYWSIYTAPEMNKNYRVNSYFHLFLSVVIHRRLLGPQLFTPLLQMWSYLGCQVWLLLRHWEGATSLQQRLHFVIIIIFLIYQNSLRGHGLKRTVWYMPYLHSLLGREINTIKEIFSSYFSVPNFLIVQNPTTLKTYKTVYWDLKKK